MSEPEGLEIAHFSFNTGYKEGVKQEREAIVEWLRSAIQPMTHTAWALARDIEAGEHLK